LQVVRPYVYATAQGAFRTPSGSGESSLGDIEEELQRVKLIKQKEDYKN
jgi:hypothetical protein